MYFNKRQSETEDGPSFYCFIVNPTLDLQNLMVPTEFVENHGRLFSDHVYLRTPGLEHKVAWEKRCDMAWLAAGWKDFAEYYSLAFRYFLEFEYKGNSRFNVRIIDDEYCEIHYLSFGTQRSIEEEDENENESSDKDEGDNEDESAAEGKNGNECSDKDEDVNENESSDKDEGDNEDESEAEGDVKASRAYTEAKALNCSNPSFIVTMNRSYVGNDGRLWIPMGYSKRYFKEGKMAKLQRANPNGKAWDIIIKRGGGGFRFGKGWQAFRRANRLEVNDVCKFELINDGNRAVHTYRVHIFRHD